MWIRQCELEADSDDSLPIPAQIASNEEFVPPPQSLEQREYKHRALDLADRAAKKQGRSRRDFLRSGSGMAAAMIALNQAHGEAYDVDLVEAFDQDAFQERWPKDQFIFDVQTHHVDVNKNWYDDTPTGRGVTRFFERLRPEAKTRDEALEQLNRAHYVKEVFGDSDTVMAVIS